MNVTSISKASAHSFLFLCIFALIVGLVWQTNTTAQHSFAIRTLEQQKDVLTQEMKDLEWEIAEQRSLASVTQRASDMALTTPSSISFLEVGLSTVAVVDDTERRQ